MAAQNEITPPEWVFPGAQVVVATTKRSGTVSLVDTITNVGKAWITLKNESTRVRIRDLQSAHQGSPYDGASVRIVEQYTDEGQRLLNDTRVLRATNRLWRIAEAWKSNPRGEAERANLREALDRLDRVIEETT